jgi:hypothetical protein
LLRWTTTLTYLVSLLTNFNTCSVVRFPASPAAEKKLKQRLNMAAEKKKAQQDKVAKRKITRLPTSPAAEKKQKQQLNMTAEKKGSAGQEFA